jgi:hypothetical protein
MVELDEQTARHILEHCPARTDEALQVHFGISYNTLLKIEKREPIRRSLAQRLEERLRADIPS